MNQIASTASGTNRRTPGAEPLRRPRHARLAWPALCLLSLGLLGVAPGNARGEAPVAREALDKIVQPLIDEGWLAGVVVGVVDPRGSAVYGYGRAKDDDPTAPDGCTVFEIGSVSKVFTGLLLAQMTAEREVRLDMPLAELLPDSVTVPQHEQRAITLRDLATHSSGLPRLPNNLRPRDPLDPYVDYTVEAMYEFLSGHTLRRAPGAKSEYSNLGVGLLGHALALKAGVPYEDLIVERICRPLGMDDTRITLDESLEQRFAQPHDADGKPVKPWNIGVLSGAGGLRSTADDMLRFAAANLGLVETPLAEPIRVAQSVHYSAPDGSQVLGLGWHRQTLEQLVWHNGQTGGFHSMLLLDPRKKYGVVVLTNTGTGRYVDELAHRVLSLARGEEAKPFETPKVVKLDDEALDALAGRYALQPVGSVTVRRDGEALFAQFDNQAPIRLWPESPDKFFLRGASGSFTFARDDQGHVDRLTIEVGSQRINGTREK